MPPNCTALNLSDKSLCGEEVTSLNGLFCYSHSRQCQGLYRGYKLRNAQLDALAASPPYYLTTSSTPLANQEFDDISSQASLKEIHDYFALECRLLDRVIRARKTHHERFFSMNMDYGHQHFIDRLQSRKHIVSIALSRLERRLQDILHKKKVWLGWVQKQQDEEESHRETEKKKIRREAALRKRTLGLFKLRMKQLRHKEDAKRQEEYLEQAYRERLVVDEEEEATWDPIEDLIEADRGNYAELINLFLMIQDETFEEAVADGRTSEEEQESPRSASTSTTLTEAKTAKGTETSDTKDEAPIETKTALRRRLKEGVDYTYAPGLRCAGTLENPIETVHHSAPLRDEEVEALLVEVAEIKHLLFCRLLLSNAKLLPAAIRANNIEDFLRDEEVAIIDLRDLCLKLENPELQEIRDACADLFRIDEEPDNEDERAQLEEFQVSTTRRSNPLKEGFRRQEYRDNRSKVWNSEREKQLEKRRRKQQNAMDSLTSSTMVGYIDFGALPNVTSSRGKKMRIKVCGRFIYNYPSEKAMNRGGWLHFSIIAKDSNLADAICLCRNWDEFFELSLLTVWQYFPANWMYWLGDRRHQEYLMMAFIPYQVFRDASKLTAHHQTGSRGLMRRSHASSEARNFIAAHVDRNDPVSRRFIRYMSMQTHRVLLLVRDANTGRILLTPPKEELWLVREKAGIGRASKNEWTVTQKVGFELFEQLEAARKWTLGFNDHYDIIIWDIQAGEDFWNIHSVVQQMLYKAHRMRRFVDMYSVGAHILKTLTRDRETHRVRDIKPGEMVDSVFDDAHGENVRFGFRDQNARMNDEQDMPRWLFYNDVDVLEDQILFPNETLDENQVVAPGIGEVTTALDKLEVNGPDWYRFVCDLDTDEETEENDSESNHKSSGNGSTEEGDDNASEDNMSLGSSDGNGGALTHHHKPPWTEGCKTPFTDGEEDALARLPRRPLRKPQYHEDMYEIFQKFMRRESSKAFKEAWHRADLAPNAQQKYVESTDLAKKMEKFQMHQHELLYFTPLAFLRVDPREHRRIMPDMRIAFAMMAIFFPSKFFQSEAGLPYREHMIVQQAERMKNVPNWRRHDSNKCMPSEFWREWDGITKNGYVEEDFPVEWDMAIRPILAHLYKEGILRSSYLEGMGHAIAAREPGRELDLYVDFRCMMDDMTPKPGMSDPPSTEHILLQARRFASKHQTARYAILRIWSSPHFYPLLIGLARGERISFLDGQGRVFEWKFIPKDMPMSEWSVHRQAKLRIEPFKHLFGAKLVAKRDLFLVMGEDEKDLLNVAAAATYAIQTDPWRFEVDLWRSFVNIDIETLEGLNRRWVD